MSDVKITVTKNVLKVLLIETNTDIITPNANYL